jgi:AcrR family transcriptional regulator
MGVQERRKREREAREQQILAAAKELFVSEGYEGASIERIAAKIELSKRTIYLYFDSKDELYYAVAKPGMETMAEMFRKAAAEEGNGLSKFASIGIAYTEFWERYPDQRRILNTTAFIKPPRTSGPRGRAFEEVSLDIIRTMMGTIAQGLEDGSIREGVDPLVAAFCISSSLQGVLQNLDSREADLWAMEIPRKRMISETLGLFGKALANPGQDCESILRTKSKEVEGKGGREE